MTLRSTAGSPLAATGGNRRNGSLAPEGPPVRVLHAAVSGRVRLAVPGLKQDAALARRLELEASSWRGVRRATANPLTGNLLLEFDPAAASSDQFHAQLQAAVASQPARLQTLPLANGSPAAGRSQVNGRRRLRDPDLTPHSVGRAGASGGPALGAATLLDALEARPVPPPLRPSLSAVEAAVIAATVVGTGALLLAVRSHCHNLVVDQAPLEFAETIHHPALTGFMRGASRLVEPPVLWAVTVAATALGVGRTGPGQLPWLAPVAVLGGGSLIPLLKGALQRGRPAAFEPLVRAGGYSLPSGHAFMAVCLYGLLLHNGLRWLSANRPSERRAAALMVVAALAAILLVGASRVYLGVHYPTDVLAGYALALLWLVVLYRFLPRRD